MTAGKDQHPHTYTQEKYMNPFELRFNVFNTAKDFLETQYKANLAAWELLNKTSKQVTDLAPKFPTMEEVIDKAIEINKFVSDAQREEVLKLKRSGVSVIF
jgi:hypothetical protein